jgi:ABC-type bacteriocin/lantibiotic exporter with double-glycine peptidase domain
MNTGISLKNIFVRFKGKIIFTMSICLLESVVYVLFPLIIGIAINGLLQNNYNGLWYLGGIGILSLVMGSGRRFFDTRIYASIYKKIAFELVQKEQAQKQPVSTTNARIGLLSEFIDFFEDTFPSILMNLIGLGGTLVILAVTGIKVFLACIIVLVLTVIVYWATTDRNIRYNSGYNDIYEKQVEALSGSHVETKNYFHGLMKWNIRLSDLETVNFSIIWIFMMGLLMYAVAVSVQSGGSIEYGTVFSTIMYVFQFIEGALTLPLYYQQMVRLREISVRLAS